MVWWALQWTKPGVGLCTQPSQPGVALPPAQGAIYLPDALDGCRGLGERARGCNCAQASPAEGVVVAWFPTCSRYQRCLASCPAKALLGDQAADPDRAWAAPGPLEREGRLWLAAPSHAAHSPRRIPAEGPAIALLLHLHCVAGARAGVGNGAREAPCYDPAQQGQQGQHSQPNAGQLTLAQDELQVGKKQEANV